MKVQIRFLKQKFKKSKKKSKVLYGLKITKKSLQMVYKKIFQKKLSGKNFRKKTFRIKHSGKNFLEKTFQKNISVKLSDTLKMQKQSGKHFQKTYQIFLYSFLEKLFSKLSKKII